MAHIITLRKLKFYIELEYHNLIKNGTAIEKV